MNGENQLTFALWMMTLHLIAGTGKFRAQLEPKEVVKHVGESLELVCTALDCPSEATFTWKTLQDFPVGGAMKSNQMTSRKTYNHIMTEDEKTVVCQVDCGGIKEQRTTKIKVYSFPSDPVISRKNDLTLMCTVRSVYTSEMFQLCWLLGDNVLSDKEETFDGVKDVSSEYTLSEEYLGKNITCRGVLNLNGIPEGQMVRSVTAQYGPAFFTISSNTTVKVGERLELRCDADGKSNITWRKLGKSEVLSRDKVTVIENVTWSDAGVYECEASTELASRRSTVGVTIQGPPNVPKLRLSHAGNPRAGDNVTITCDSDSVPPAQLTISWASLTQVEKHSSFVSIKIPSIQLKHSGLYFCEAKNEFGSKRSSINITVQAPPRNSTVLVYPSAQVMEAQNITVHCSTVSFPPASIILMREADEFEFRSPNGNFHLFNLKSEDKGTYMVNFTNELGYEVQTFELIIKGPPNVPKLRLSHAGNPRAGDYVTITCDSDSVHPVQLTISGGLNKVEKHSSSVSINIPSIQLKDSGLYFCNAKNELGSKRSSINITVQAPPRNSTVLVYPSAQVMEAQNITVHCSTVSFPPASIILMREADGFQEFRSTNGTFHLFNLKLEDKGTYMVNFTNELGYEVQTFDLIIKEQTPITAILTKTMVPAVSSMSLLTAAALLLRHLRRTKRNSGDFNLGKALDM
ncbi:hypothetical protein MHYP_G00002730 [Metynnis hypsauchen]